MNTLERRHRLYAITKGAGTAAAHATTGAEHAKPETARKIFLGHAALKGLGPIAAPHLPLLGSLKQVIRRHSGVLHLWKVPWTGRGWLHE
jgi:hypothetical protein